MVKELVLTATVPNFTAQDYYAAVYETPDAFEQYHREHTNDPNSKVSPWQGGERTVQFNLALNVPQMLKKVIGTDCIAVVETQELKWHDKDKFVVSSIPSLNFPGSNRFITKGTMTINTVNGACQVEAMISCTTTMPWPMQSTVEAAMAAEAQSGIAKFLAYCEKWCEGVKAKGVLPATAEPVSVPVTVVTPVEETEEPEVEDMYYDAWDEAQQETANNLAGGAIAPVAPGAPGARRAVSGGVEVGRPASQMRTAALGGAGGSSQEVLMLASLRELQVASHATAQALGEVLGQLKQLNENVGSIRAAITGNNAPKQSVSGYGLFGSGMSGYGMAVVVLAGASTAAVMYVRSRQRSA